MKFVDQIGFQEITRNFTAAHQPYVLALMLTNFFHQRLRRDIHEGLTFALTRRQHAGKNIRLDLWTETTFALGFGNVIGLAAHDAGIDGREELRHGEISGHKQKVECAIWPSDVAVNTYAESENDFAHGEEL